MAASPSAKGAYYILAVDATKNDYNDEISSEAYALRPVVSLPKTVMLEWSEETSKWKVK